MENRLTESYFLDKDSSLETHWRSIVLLGRNVASYKFALAKTLLEFPTTKTLITLEELALPFAKNISEHLKTNDKHIINPSSKFLDYCRQFNNGELNEEQLLDALTDSITGRPAPDLDAVDGHVERLHCGPKVRETMALAQVYAERKFDAGRFFQRMGEVVCRDDFSEMHAFKHLQSAKEEYQAMRTPLGWAHIVSSAKMAWCTYGHAQDVYQQATEHLAV